MNDALNSFLLVLCLIQASNHFTRKLPTLPLMHSLNLIHYSSYRTQKRNWKFGQSRAPFDFKTATHSLSLPLPVSSPLSLSHLPSPDLMPEKFHHSPFACCIRNSRYGECFPIRGCSTQSTTSTSHFTKLHTPHPPKPFIPSHPTPSPEERKNPA